MKAIRRLLVLQHLEIEGPGLFEQFAKERDLKIEIIRLDNKNDLPQTKKGDLILIMGGPMGVKDIGRDRYPWLKLEIDFIKKYGKGFENRLKGTGVTPSYRSWYENDCFVSIAAGTYQEDTWSAMKWFSVNVCSESAEIMESE